MFDKYRAFDITKLYLKKYDELKKVVVSGTNEKRKETEILFTDNLLNIYIEPTNHCNFNCKFCVREKMVRERHNILLDNFKKVIDVLPKGSYISLLGNGEPLLHPHIYDMIEYAATHELHTAVITNASALNAENRKKLIKSRPSRIQMSFESLDKQINEKIMRGSNFKRELQNILEFIYEVRQIKSKILITISRVDYYESAEYADITRKFWSKIPIDNYYEGPLLSMQTGSGEYNSINVEENYKCCANPWLALKINADGTVNPCVLDYNSQYIIGNIYDNSFDKIVNSERALVFREAVLTGNMEFLDEIGYHCRTCNTWTKKVGGNICSFLENTFPIRLGLAINEVAGERPNNVEFLERVLDYVRAGGVDIISRFGEELKGD